MIRHDDTIHGFGEKTEFELAQDGTLIVKTSQDVEDILENNKELRKVGQRSEWGRHIASIPNVILTRWLNEELDRGNTTIKMFGPEMDALAERKLKDPEWAYLRTDSKHTQAYTGWNKPLPVFTSSDAASGIMGFSS